MAAIFNLNHPAHVITWHFISLSVANLVVIAVMLMVFVLAIVVPFPHGERGGDARMSTATPERRPAALMDGRPARARSRRASAGEAAGRPPAFVRLVLDLCVRRAVGERAGRDHRLRGRS